jgi:hypothetical protein
MLMVVFGAGASYDSAPSLPVLRFRDYEARPPLSDEMFQDRDEFASIAMQYRPMLPIVPYLRDLPGKSVEAVLEELENEAQNFARRKSQLISVKFYLRDVLRRCTSQWLVACKGVTNYRTLLDQIARHYQTEEPIPLVTFNYDALLENALGEHGFRLVTTADYIGPSSAFKLFKLLGSVNWSRLIQYPGTPNMNANEIIERAADLQLTDHYYCDIAGQGGSYVPAIAVPVRNKASFECPKEHVEELQRLLPSVTKILFVGWMGKEQHFLQMLKGSAKSLQLTMFVASGSGEATEIAKRVMEDIGRTSRQNTYITEGGFTEFIRQKQGDAFFGERV